MIGQNYFLKVLLVLAKFGNILVFINRKRRLIALNDKLNYTLKSGYNK